MTTDVRPPKARYLVWQLDNGRWAARRKQAWPLRAADHVEGATPTAAIKAWDRRFKQAIKQFETIRPTVQERSVNRYDGSVRVQTAPGNWHCVHYCGQGKKATVCGKPRDLYFTTRRGRLVSCEACRKAAKVGLYERGTPVAETKFRKAAKR